VSDASRHQAQDDSHAEHSEELNSNRESAVTPAQEILDRDPEIAASSQVPLEEHSTAITHQERTSTYGLVDQVSLGGIN